MEIREPKKSKGVPKQNRIGTLLQEIADTFIHPYGSKYLDKINNSMKDSGYWEASLSEQMVILSKLFFDSVDDPKQILKILKNSKSEHLRGLAPGMGNRLRTKNFIIASLTLKAKESKTISKTFHFVDYNSTPRLPGKYNMILYCNGNEIKKRSFIYQG